MLETLRDYSPGIMILGIPALAFALLFIWRDGNLRRRGVTVRAECINHGRNSDGNVCLQLRFVIDGTAHACETMHYKFPPVPVGGRTDVVYDPKDPRQAMMKTELGRGVGAWVTASVVAALLLATAAAYL